MNFIKIKIEDFNGKFIYGGDENDVEELENGKYNINVKESLNLSGSKNFKILKFEDVKLNISGFQFKDCKNFKIECEDFPIITKETSMRSAFKNCEDFEIDLSKWNLKDVKIGDKMFKNCKRFKLKNNVLNFENAKSLISLFKNSDFNSDLKIISDKCERIDSMFEDCSDLNSDIHFEGFKNLKSTRKCFKKCERFNSKIKMLHLNNIIDASGMFACCARMKKLHLNENECQILKFNSLVDSSSMFSDCFKLNQKITFVAEKLLYAKKMFEHCESLNSEIIFQSSMLRDISSFCVGAISLKKSPKISSCRIEDMAGAFGWCYSLEEVVGINFKSVEDYMFTFSNTPNLKFVDSDHIVNHILHKKIKADRYGYSDESIRGIFMNSGIEMIGNVHVEKNNQGIVTIYGNKFF